MPYLITTLGPKSAAELGMILPHEHVFTDLRPLDHPYFGRAEVGDVVRLMAPELERARAAGITAIVEASAAGIARRPEVLRAVSEAAHFPLVAPTGIYREPWVPDWAHEASEEQLRDWMLGELEDQIEGSGVRAGWIKLSAGDDGMTPCEVKILRAAAAAGRATHATIGSHTIRGRVVREQLAAIEQAGYTAQRFIWIHAMAEPDQALHLEVARRGAWIEYDAIGGEPTEAADERYVRLILSVLDAGLGDRLLLSQDRGLYDPAQPGGGTPRPFTYIVERFLPRLRAAGVDEPTIRRLTCENPFRAFAR
jgi:phosphotriesterase-related protein